MQGREWKITDFEPLTELPWKDPATPMDQVLDRIFRETNVTIRYAVLAEYLNRIDIAKFEKAFDLAVELEGTQTPDQVVGLMLHIWAQRNPEAAWKRTQELFKLVGIEHGWLQCDSWTRRERITVQDREAIERAGYWLERRGTLLHFPRGVAEATASPKDQKVVFFKRFADVWFERFQSWPEDNQGQSTPLESLSSGPALVRAFEEPPKAFPDFIDRSPPNVANEAIFEIALRRWLASAPTAGLRIVQWLSAKRWTNGIPPPGGPPSAQISTELLLLWSKLDFQGLLQLAEEPPGLNDKLPVWEARGMVWTQISQGTRQRWIDELMNQDFDGPSPEPFIAWQPNTVVGIGLRLKDPHWIADAIASSTRDPFGSFLPNAIRATVPWMLAFEVQSIPESLRSRFTEESFGDAMVLWGEVDVASAARFGTACLLAINTPPRGELLRFFSGEDLFPDDGGVLDRTFCALRVWAVTRPKEMRAWIATQEGDDLKKALTWLLEHPWGGE